MSTGTRDTITSLFKQFAGQDGVLVIPRAYIDFCQGDHLAALLLSQILYWSDRTEDADGWFAKSYDDWQKELCMTDYQVKRAIDGDKRRKGGGFRLKDIGIETTLRQSKFYGGAATLHYRVNQEKLKKSVSTFLDSDNVENEGKAVSDNVGNPIPTKSKTRSLQSRKRSTENTTETIAETTKDSVDTPTAINGGEVTTPLTPQDDPAPEDKPVRADIALIDAYWSALPGGQPADEDYPRHLKLASKVAKQGRILPADIVEFMGAVYDPNTDVFDYKKWHSRPIPFEEVIRMYPVWRAKHPKPRVHIIPAGWLEPDAHLARVNAYYAENREMIENLPEVKAARAKRAAPKGGAS